MSAREAKLLDELRKKELRALTEQEFQTVKSEVESKGVRGLKGSSAQIVYSALRSRDKEMKKAVSVKVGDMVSWGSSGGNAKGKVLRIERSGRINVPDSSFNIQGTEDDPAVLIALYRDGKPTDTKVGHKMSTLKKNFNLTKHGDHDQSSHGSWRNADDSEGEDSSEPKKLKDKFVPYKDDSEGEFEELDADSPRWMDDMDILRPPRVTPSQRY